MQVPDAQYECLVQAKNRYGWSEASRIHRFNTNPASYGKFCFTAATVHGGVVVYLQHR